MSEIIKVGIMIFDVSLGSSGNVLPKYIPKIKPVGSVSAYSTIQDATKNKSAFVVKEPGLGKIIDIQI